MQKLDINISDNVNNETTDKLIQALKKNSAISYVLNKNEIPSDVIEKFPWRLREWLISFKPCQNCEGLHACKQKTKGYFNNLTYDGLLDWVITPCHFQREVLNATKHMENYLVSDLGVKNQTVSFKNINVENEDDDYLLVLEEAMQASDNHKGLYIYGTMGSGKTYLAACACNEHAKNGEKVAFVHYPSFCKRIAELHRTDEDKDEFNRLRRVKFLVIDDIGAESVTAWNRDSILFPLLEHRYENGLTTWFTSNIDLDMLDTHFQYTSKGDADENKSARIIERIKHMTKVIALTGKDRRISL